MKQVKAWDEMNGDEMRAMRKGFGYTTKERKGRTECVLCEAAGETREAVDGYCEFHKMLFGARESGHPNDPDGFCRCEECSINVGGKGHWTLYITEDNDMAASHPHNDPVYVAQMEKERLVRKAQRREEQERLGTVTDWDR